MDFKNPQTRNKIFASFEFIFEAFVSFFIYKYILSISGIEALGIWSLTISLASMTGYGTSGFASSAVKYVAKYHTLGDETKTKEVIVAVTLVVLVVNILIASIIYVLYQEFQTGFFSASEIKAVDEIILSLLISTIIGTLARVFISCLEGFNLIHLRSIIGICSKILQSISFFIFVPSLKLVGLAHCQFILQTSLLILSLIFLLKNYTITWKDVKHGISKNTFQDIFNYGLIFQINSVILLVFDPIIKFFMKNYGGVNAVGVFELVQKLYWQIRQFLIVLIQVDVPIVAKFREIERKKISERYLDLLSVLFPFALIFLFVLIPVAEFLQDLFHINEIPHMTVYFLLVPIGLYINLLGSPAFIYNMGTGNMGQNTIAKVAGIMFFVVLSYFLGRAYQDVGVLWSWALSFTIDSAILIYLFNSEEEISWKEFFTRTHLLKILPVTFLYLYLIYFFNSFGGFYWYINTGLFLVYAFTINLIAKPINNVFNLLK